ncbi:hypothetical protein KR200_007241, partial [Drosophila serrata]
RIFSYRGYITHKKPTNFIISVFTFQVNSLLEFTNVICEPLDKNFCGFEYCRLEKVNKTFKYITAKVLLFQKPVSKVRINGALYKRSNGYKPYLYNVTIDGCKFFKTLRARPVSRLIYDFLNSTSNLNHSCPYDHDIYVSNLSDNYLNNHITHILTFPKGDYLFQMHWFAYNINRSVIKLYFSLK